MKPKMNRFLPAIRLVLLSWVLCPASCQSFSFSCQYTSLCQMKMFIPEYQQSFVVSYNLDTGAQEKIIRCEWSNEGNNYTCSSNDGYSCEILEHKSLLINIQTDLQPGNFSLQIRGNDADFICSWNPKESCRNISNPETSSTISSTAPTVGVPQHTASLDRPNNVTVTNGSVHNPPPAKESSTIWITVGSGVGVILLIGIVGISIYFYKKPGCPCHKKPNNHDSSGDYIEQPLNTEPDEREGENNSLNTLSDELVSETSNNRSTGNSSFYHPRNSEVLHSRGAYIEDISSPSQTNIPNRGRTRFYRKKRAVAVSCMGPDFTDKQDIMKQMSE